MRQTWPLCQPMQAASNILPFDLLCLYFFWSRVVKERLGVPPKVIIGYQSHADTATKSGSTTKNKFVAWGLLSRAPLLVPFLHFFCFVFFLFSFECSRRKTQGRTAEVETQARFHVVFVLPCDSFVLFGFFFLGGGDCGKCSTFVLLVGKMKSKLFSDVLTLLCRCNCILWLFFDFFFWNFNFLQPLLIVTKTKKNPLRSC